MLTQAQYQFFQTFGFVVLRQVFTKSELLTIDREFEAGLNAAHADKPFDGTERHGAILTGADTPFFAHLPEDPRVYEIAEQLYGEDCFSFCTDANRYVGDTRWHPDHHNDVQRDCYGIKFAYYIDPVDADTGALRVIPGSHRNPLHADIQDRIKELDLPIRDLPCHICESEPGDLVAFDVRLWHASCGGATGRRMCTVVYYKNPHSPEEDPGMRWRADNCVQATAPRPFVNPHWAANSKGSARRAAWLEKLRHWGFMEEPA